MILTQLATSRLILRPFTSDDINLMQLLDLDQEVVRFLGHGRIRSLEESQKNLTKIQNDYKQHGLGLFAVYHKDSGEFIGRSGLIPWTLDGLPTWEIGYSFMPSAWGQGYATEASKALAQWGKENLKVPHLVSLIQSENHKSISVAKKMGMSLWKEVALSNRTLLAYKLDLGFH